MSNNKQQTKRLLIISGIVDIGLGIIKIVIGMISNSYALVVDGIHSLSDLATDVMVWFFNEIGAEGPDDDHPYGHAKFETFGTFLLGCLLIILAAFLVYDSITRLLSLADYTTPTWPALAASFISIAAKEWLYQATAKLGRKTRSQLLQANAWHHRTDALSSVIVFVGVVGALLGFPWLELLAAIGVASMIALIGGSLTKQSVAELVDTALSESYVEDIRKQVQHVEGVSGVHSIRTRRMGADALVDIQLQVDPSISVSEGHHIGEWVTKRLLGEFLEVNDVIVHIDAEDDELLEERVTEGIAPLRREVRKSLSEVWDDILPDAYIEKMNLHYLNNGVNVEIFLDRAIDRKLGKDLDHQHARESGPGDHNLSGLQVELKNAGDHLPWLEKISIWYR